MECHYVVLGIERDASDDQIKKAYRKAAIKWHPDKNLDDPDGAAHRFRLIQQAYEVLSDAQEREWYDSHREQILRGKKPGEAHDSDDDDAEISDLMGMFSSTCYEGYEEDNPKNFYAV
eukprot:g64560.t1